MTNVSAFDEEVIRGLRCGCIYALLLLWIELFELCFDQNLFLCCSLKGGTKVHNVEER
jgi:hypothetical protein